MVATSECVPEINLRCVSVVFDVREIRWPIHDREENWHNSSLSGKRYHTKSPGML